LGSILFFLRAIFFNILSLRASLIVREQVSLRSKSRIINKFLESKLEKKGLWPNDSNHKQDLIDSCYQLSALNIVNKIK
jgi:hypothetical protein